MNWLTEAWILISAVLCLGGWLLSAVDAFNALGYLVFLALAAGCMVWWWRTKVKGCDCGWAIHKLRRRFRRPLPLAFLILSLLAILGGLLHPTNNYDELTYRLPRVLHWLSDGHWHWIHAEDARLNTRAMVFEFLTAPMVAIWRTDRPLFLINVISYLLFPGLIYSVFIRLGVRRRAAWCWMWLLPAGFTFILQAASTANDMFACVYVLAAVGYALRARQTGRTGDLWLSILSAGLMTGAKGSNLPLLLPWVVAFWPVAGSLLRRPLVSAAVVVVALAVSFLPTALLNFSHCGDWTGTALEAQRYQLNNPVVGIAGNAVMLTLDSLMPPIMPLPQSMADRLVHLLPSRFLEMYNSHFTSEFKIFTGIMTEDGAGLGLGIGLLLICSVLAALWFKLKSPTRPAPECRRQWWLAMAIVVAFLAFCAKAGMGQASRLCSPYYPLLFAVLLQSPAQERIVRRRWWKGGAALALLMALIVVVLSPPRPLMPAQTLIGWLESHNVRNPFLERAKASYLGNAQRNDALAPVRALIPNDVEVLGFVSSGDDIEPSLWRPFGQRRVVHFFSSDSAADLQKLGVQYVVVSGETLDRRGQSWEDWLKANHAKEYNRISLTHSFPPYHPYMWYVAQLKDGN